MLISRVLPIMSIYRLPYGQYGYSGHILNLPQDVASFINSLPRCPSTLDVIIVRREGGDNSHRDFRVRRAKVLTALEWLVANNRYYAEVTIDNHTLGTLPIDDHLTNVSSIFLSSNDVKVSAQNDDDDSNLQSTFVLTSARTFTEQQMIHQSIVHSQSSHSQVNWPTTRGPINEFTTEGYISCAFPTLFPQGIADFLAPRQRIVTIASYFKHLMLYHDQHFACHP